MKVPQRPSGRVPSTRAGRVKSALVGTLVVGGIFAPPAVERWHDQGHCRGWTPYKGVEPEYFERAVELCVEGRQAYRAGPFGIFGPELKGRAAGRCGQLWAAVEVPPAQELGMSPAAVLERYGIQDRFEPNQAGKERFMDACIPARVSELEARGSPD